MNNRTGSTTQQRYRAALLVLGVLLVLLVGLWLTGGTSSPTKVLGCVWDRANADATATTAPDCR